MNIVDDTFDRQLPTYPPEGPDASDLTEFALESDPPQPRAAPADAASVRAAAERALKTVYDPEIPINIHDLGLIYGLEVDDDGRVECRMTLTAPGCPVAGAIVREVHAKLLSVDGVTHVRTQLVWDPPWSRDRMSEAALLELGFF
jgi:FeS assembly SUF system protein